LAVGEAGSKVANKEWTTTGQEKHKQGLAQREDTLGGQTPEENQAKPQTSSIGTNVSGRTGEAVTDKERAAVVTSQLKEPAETDDPNKAGSTILPQPTDNASIQTANTGQWAKETEAMTTTTTVQEVGALPDGQECEMVMSTSPSTGPGCQTGTLANGMNNDSESTTAAQPVEMKMMNTEATDQTNQAPQSVGINEQGSEPIEVEASMDKTTEQTKTLHPAMRKDNLMRMGGRQTQQWWHQSQAE